MTTPLIRFSLVAALAATMLSCRGSIRDSVVLELESDTILISGNDPFYRNVIPVSFHNQNDYPIYVWRYSWGDTMSIQHYMRCVTDDKNLSGNSIISEFEGDLVLIKPNESIRSFLGIPNNFVRGSESKYLIELGIQYSKACWDSVRPLIEYKRITEQNIKRHFIKAANSLSCDSLYQGYFYCRAVKTDKFVHLEQVPSAVGDSLFKIFNDRY